MLSQSVYQAGIILLGILGLSVSVYLHHKKKTSVESMACPMDGSCEQVITSKYSKFLGFDVEILGIIYYATILVAYSMFLLTPQIAPTWFVFGVLMSSVVAVLFSSYLTYLQGVTLKMWCTWCLISASISVGILALTVPAATIGLTSLMANYASLLLWVSVVAAASGLGTALSYNTLLSNSLKDFELSDIEVSTLNTIDQLTWVALAALLVSSIGLVTADASLLGNPAFLTSGFVLAFLIFNDSVHSLFVSEKLIQVRYKQDEESEQIPYNLDKYVLVLAATSLYSWVSLLTLKLFEPGFTTDELIGFYLLGLMLVTLAAVMVNKVTLMRAENNLPDWSPLH